jgi:putative peptidoglycan lipid II flippase
MDGSGERQLVRGIWANSLGTLLSRVLGLLRDVATAWLLGLGQGGVMDALVVALRIPNFARRFFGEGALTASLMPVLEQQRRIDTGHAWRLLSALLVLLGLGLTLLVIAGEGLLLVCRTSSGGERGPLLGLTAITLPYMLLICLAAQAAAGLQSVGRFRSAAFAPALLNVCWLGAAWLVAPRWTGDPETQARVMAAAILISGILQLGVLLAALAKAGFRFQLDFRTSGPAVRQVMRGMLPIALGLGVTQITTLVDSILAVALAAPGGSSERIWWLAGAVTYPLETGAAAAIYYGERFYQLPLGVLGMAIATVLYPTLSRHAAGGDRRSVGAELTRGLRLVWFTALPAGVGMMLLAEPIVRALFVRGAFTPHDGQRAATMITWYASAAWANCALPLLVRSFYALGERGLPLRAGAVAVAVDLLTTLVLVWPLGEAALAISTALGAIVQIGLLCTLFSRCEATIDWRPLSLTLFKGAVATAGMAIAVVLLREFWLPTQEVGELLWQLVLVVGIGAATYASLAWMLGMTELRLVMLADEAKQLVRAPDARSITRREPAAAVRGSGHQAMISRMG